MPFKTRTQIDQDSKPNLKLYSVPTLVPVQETFTDENGVSSTRIIMKPYEPIDPALDPKVFSLESSIARGYNLDDVAKPFKQSIEDTVSALNSYPSGDE